MMNLDAMPVWVIVRENGDVVHPEYDGQPPRKHLQKGDVLSFSTETTAFAIYAVDGASIDFITTVDRDVNGGAIRRAGPGIVFTDATVRMWVSPVGDLVVLTNGSVERAIQASQRLDGALCGSNN